MTPHDNKKQLVRALQPVLDRVRKDISAIKLADGSRWTDEPITTHAMERHVNGGPGRGACPIKEGESVTMLAVLDMDSHKGATSWADMLAAASELSSTLLMWGLEAIAFRSSGGRGIHLLVLWETPQDAYSVRQALTTLIGMCGFKNGAKGIAHKQIEIFPKQDEVGIGEKGSQFILPLAGASEPLDLELGIPLGRDAVIGMQWPMSVPVPVLERPVRLATGGEADEPIEKVREALFSIRNDGTHDWLDYEAWWKLGAAVHAATGGSEEGRQVFVEWSEQYPDFDEKFFEDRVWPYYKDPEKRSSAIGKGTLYQMAMTQGKWTTATPDGFTDVEGAEDEPEMPAVKSSAANAVSDTAGDDGRDLPPFKYDPKAPGVVILATIGNLLLALRRPDICGWSISHDSFRDEIMISTNGGVGWRSFRDADYTRMREHLEKNGFAPIGKENMRDAVELVAQETGFDSAILWIKSLPKNEGGRIDTFLSTYMGCEDTPYTRAVSRYMWSALAGRVLSPGCQADMAPVFIGGQGSGKTSAVKAIAPAIDFYVEVGFHEKEDDLARKMRGRLIGEVAELTGMRKKEVEALKAFMTRTHENWIPKFKEFGALFPRRLLFIGTTNQERFLVDDTGNRRWLPVHVGESDLEALKRDVLLLWAEARELYLADGIQYAEAERLARAVHSQHEVEDPWEATVTDWLDSSDLAEGSKRRDRPYITTAMVLTEALHMQSDRAKTADLMRAGNVLRKLGFLRTKVRLAPGETINAYVPTLFLPARPEVGTDIPF